MSTETSSTPDLLPGEGWWYCRATCYDRCGWGSGIDHWRPVASDI